MTLCGHNAPHALSPGGSTGSWRCPAPAPPTPAGNSQDGGGQVHRHAFAGRQDPEQAERTDGPRPPDVRAPDPPGAWPWRISLPL